MVRSHRHKTNSDRDTQRQINRTQCKSTMASVCTEWTCTHNSFFIALGVDTTDKMCTVPNRNLHRSLVSKQYEIFHTILCKPFFYCVCLGVWQCKLQWQEIYMYFILRTVKFHWCTCISLIQSLFVSEDVKKEDLVSSLLKYIVAELVHTVYLNANLLGIKKAYFCGNFVNHDVTRRKITAQFTLKNWSKSVRKYFL